MASRRGLCHSTEVKSPALGRVDAAIVVSVVFVRLGEGLLRLATLPDRDPGDRPADPTWKEIVEMALVLEADIGPTMVLEMRGSEMWTSALGHEVRLGFPIDLADKARTLLALLGGDVPTGAMIDVTSPRRPAIVAEDPAP